MQKPAGRRYITHIMRTCESKEIHLISDEIYGLSVYKEDGYRSDPFTSVLSIDPSGLINQARLHVLYGLSKVAC